MMAISKIPHVTRKREDIVEVRGEVGSAVCKTRVQE